ncbi:MAG TPA: DNA-binding transcriptional regulator [Pirellulales bacterium]
MIGMAKSKGKPPARKRVLLIIETTLAYGREALRGINRYAVAHGPWSMYLDLHALLSAPPKWLETWDGDGVLSRQTTPETAAMLKSRGIPVVDMTDVHGDLGLPHVWTDHAAASAAAASHLLERGFRRFAFCGFSGHDWSTRRRDGFLASVQAAGASAEVFESPWGGEAAGTWDEQQRAIGDWLARLPKPVGVMACNDMRGQHVLDACRRQGLAVPEEVAVVGVDDDELLCEICDPPLSSVALNAERIGWEAAARLDRLMNGETLDSPEMIVEPRGVVARQSSDILALDDPQIAAAVRFIREHACQGVTVTDVLRHVPLSRSVLERRFRQKLGRSPRAEIRNVQLKRVKQLLSETDLSLERIADVAGFEHAEYLSVVFKRETGETPGGFRKRNAPAPEASDGTALPRRTR